MDDISILYWAVNENQYTLIENNNFESFPNINFDFYPVFEEKYAIEIAEYWIKMKTYDLAFVLAFFVDSTLLIDDHKGIKEWWAGVSTTQVNENLVGRIEVVAEFKG